MIQEKKFYFTPKGWERIKKEYERLKELKISKTREEIPQALTSDEVNFEYVAFEEDIGVLDSKLAELEYVLKNSDLLKIPLKSRQNIVNLGATVTLEKSNGQTDKFMIVNTFEADPVKGKISSESPLGKSLLGKKINEEVIIGSPVKTIYKIKKIKYHFS